MGLGVYHALAAEDCHVHTTPSCHAAGPLQQARHLGRHKLEELQRWLADILKSEVAEDVVDKLQAFFLRRCLVLGSTRALAGLQALR